MQKISYVFIKINLDRITDKLAINRQNLRYTCSWTPTQVSFQNTAVRLKIRLFESSITSQITIEFKKVLYVAIRTLYFKDSGIE